MFLGNLPGIERVMFNDVQAPYISLITGPPGSLKTGTALTFVSNYLRQTGEFGLYCTIEETVDSFAAIVEGELDDLPEQAFLNVGGADDARRKAAELEG